MIDSLCSIRVDCSTHHLKAFSTGESPLNSWAPAPIPTCGHLWLLFQLFLEIEMSFYHQTTTLLCSYGYQLIDINTVTDDQTRQLMWWTNKFSRRTGLYVYNCVSRGSCCNNLNWLYFQRDLCDGFISKWIWHSEILNPPSKFPHPFCVRCGKLRPRYVLKPPRFFIPFTSSSTKPKKKDSLHQWETDSNQRKHQKVSQHWFCLFHSWTFSSKVFFAPMDTRDKSLDCHFSGTLPHAEPKQTVTASLSSCRVLWFTGRLIDVSEARTTRLFLACTFSLLL